MRALFVFLLCGLAAVSVADERSDRLVRARQAISQGKDRQALPELEWLVSKSWRSAEGEEAAVLLIESSLRLGEWKKAAAQIERFLKYHTQSSYRSRVEWADVRLLLKNGELLGASKEMAQLLSRPLTAPLRQEIRGQLQRLLDSELLGQLELETVFKSGVADSLLTGEILYRLALVFEAEERWRGAIHFHHWLLHEFPEHPKAALSRDRLPALDGRGAGKPVIVLIAPLSGDLANFGNDLLQGSLLALEQSGMDQSIGWRAVDSRAQPTDALLALQNILSQENVLAVVGPVLSPVASTLAAWMSVAAPSVPLVIPVASAEGISDLGSNVFQLTPPTSEQARAVARYAMECLGHREFAVLAPRTTYGGVLSTAFVDEVEREGGTLLGVENYTEGEPDYKAHFSAFRLKGYKLLRERRLIAAGVSDLTDRTGARARTAYLADSLIAVDAVFIAASTPEDAVQLSGQKIFNKIEGQLLGTSGWYGAGLLKNGRKLVEGALFSSDFLERSDDPAWVKFSAAYQKRWATTPGQDRVAGLSYDAIRFLLYAVKKNRGEGLVSAMHSVGKIPGVYGEIILNAQSGGNSKIHLVSVKEGLFKIIEGCPEAAPSR